MPTYGGGEKCHRCKKTVYKAEDREAANKHWHKVCFSCKDCGKKLDSTTLNERKNEGEEAIYCKACYGKRFGPKGYGFGQGAGTFAYTEEYSNK